jgi:hypothetical protein
MKYKKIVGKKVLISILIVIIMAIIITATALARQIFDLEVDTSISIGITFAQTVGLIVSLFVAIFQLAASTKISRASFISDLNRSYVENTKYNEVYDKLQACIDSKCKNCDRDDCHSLVCKLNDEKNGLSKGHISNYLTFFETVYILQKSGVISYEIIDDLFAYRFFMAIHSKFVQQGKLGTQPRNFKNIFCLEYRWLKWRKNIGKDKIYDGSTVYTKLLLVDLVGETLYREMIAECGCSSSNDYPWKTKVKINDVDIRQCTSANLDAIMEIQSKTLKELSSQEASADMLRENTPEMLAECLESPNYTLGIFYEGYLVAFSVLYYPHNDEENLSRSLELESIDVSKLKSANYKLCIVRKWFRGNGFQRYLWQRLERYAVNDGVELICGTVSPKNKSSIDNLESMGFKYNKTCSKYGYERRLYYKLLGT